MASVNMRSGRHRRRLVNEINVVPYIDVMLVLLVIFMVTAPMINTGVVDVPRAGAANARPDVYAEITVRERGPLTLRLHDPGRAAAGSKAAGADEQRIDREDRQALASAVRALRDSFGAGRTPAAGGAAAGSDLPVLISAEKGVRYEAVMDVMAELQKQGIGRIALGVRR